MPLSFSSITYVYKECIKPGAKEPAYLPKLPGHPSAWSWDSEVGTTRIIDVRTACSRHPKVRLELTVVSN